jgi:hypothetical protein
MKADITRDTFHAAKHFSRVISQQGRVTLDADSNEQTAILLHYLRTLASDLIGPFAAPIVNPGFKLTIDAGGLHIGAGRYYVDGFLVENESSWSYSEQPFNPLPDDDALAKTITSKADASFWVYLDVWERHVSSLADATIREIALDGVDTCSRAQVIWQVRALDVAENSFTTKIQDQLKRLESRKATLETQQNQPGIAPKKKARIAAQLAKVNAKIDAVEKLKLRIGAGPWTKEDCAVPLSQLSRVSDALLGARLDPGLQIVDACITSPDSKYRGAENQLYRVEIHHGGVAGEATFKWSRDNGSVATEWLGTNGYDLQVASARGFDAGNWVELMDDVAELQGRPGLLAPLSKIQAGSLTVDKDRVANADVLKWNQDALNPLIRRWDHFATEDVKLTADGSIPIVETPLGTPDDQAKWIELENGIQIQFAEGGEYRTGDYWLIPARVASGKIEWPPPDEDLTIQLPPRGILHHYAPLAFAIWASGAGSLTACDCTFDPLSKCFALTQQLTPNGDFIDVTADESASASARRKRKPIRISTSKRPL